MLRSHRSVLEELCMELKNCADCYNEETHKAECCPVACIHPYDVNGKSFCLEGTYSERVNQKLAKIANKHGYSCAVISGTDGCQMRFSR